MELYCLSVSEAAKFTDEDCAARFPVRLERAKRFVHPEDRLRSIAAGALLHGILNVAEADIHPDKYGKPLLDGNAVHFNLSHSGEYAVLGVDTAPLGIDIEPLDETHLNVADKVFTAEERQWLAADPLPRFYTLWTLKESVMKAVGKGLSLSPAAFSVLPLVQGKSVTVEGSVWYGHTLTVNGHRLSVCTEKPVEQLTPVICHAAMLRDGYFDKYGNR